MKHRLRKFGLLFIAVAGVCTLLAFALVQIAERDVEESAAAIGCNGEAQVHGVRFSTSHFLKIDFVVHEDDGGKHVAVWPLFWRDPAHVLPENTAWENY